MTNNYHVAADEVDRIKNNAKEIAETTHDAYLYLTRHYLDIKSDPLVCLDVAYLYLMDLHRLIHGEGKEQGNDLR